MLQGMLDKVMLIWSRHVYQLRSELSADQALYFLKAIPPSVSTQQILHWLRIFLPDCFRLFPGMLKNVVLWCKGKIK